jgi:hypothetical protein
MNMRPIEFLRAILRPQPTNRLLDHFEWEEQARKDGFKHWLHFPPPLDAWIECKRYEWDRPATLKSGHGQPEMNVCGLFWRRPWWATWDPKSAQQAPYPEIDIQAVIREAHAKYSIRIPVGFAAYLEKKIVEAMR